jgi:DNA-binding CsgD family transcriptional regulator
LSYHSTIDLIRGKEKSKKFGLTEREIEILKLIIKGKSNRQIAGTVEIQENTVANHVSNILYKMNVQNRTEAAKIANVWGFFNPHETARNPIKNVASDNGTGNFHAVYSADNFMPTTGDNANHGW